MEAVSFLPDLSPQLHPEVTFRKASGFISLTALPPQDSQLFSLYLQVKALSFFFISSLRGFFWFYILPYLSLTPYFYFKPHLESHRFLYASCLENRDVLVQCFVFLYLFLIHVKCVGQILAPSHFLGSQCWGELFSPGCTSALTLYQLQTLHLPHPTNSLITESQS